MAQKFPPALFLDEHRLITFVKYRKPSG